ncbi:MAG: efflux RND transporter permease subunit, partial [Pirellulaceae bacterium]
ATQPIEMRLNEMASGIRSDLGIKIYGDDFEQLVSLSDEVQEVLTGIEGNSDVAGDQLTGQPTVQIKIDAEAVARFGMSGREVLDFVESVGGRSVGDVYEGQRKFPLVVRLSDQHRSDVDILRDTLIPTESGLRVPLRSVAEIVETEGISTIAREWGKRLIRVQANVAGRDVSSFVNEAQAAIAEKVTLPDGYLIDWGGQFENLMQAKRKFMLVVPVTLMLVFVLLFFSLRNLRDVALIYLGIPFAAVGGVLGLWLRGIPFSVSAAIGFIALCGIAVLNGQILVTAIRSRIAQGMDVERAVKRATADRLRPVLATAITDAVGFIPMAISTGVGAEVQRPLATVVIAGVTTSTLLTLLVLPLLYLASSKSVPEKEQRK